MNPDHYFGALRDRKRVNPTFMHPDETEAEAAERVLKLELISCGVAHQFEDDVDWFSNPTFNKYKEWTWQLLGEQYQATGDERYAEGFVRLFNSWANQAVVPEDEPGPATRCWRTIETGIRMGQTWPRALHYFINSPHFTDDVLVDWYKSLWEHGWRLRNFHWRYNWLIENGHGDPIEPKVRL